MNRRKAAWAAVFSAIPAIISAFVEYGMTGGASTWIPIVAGIIGLGIWICVVLWLPSIRLMLLSEGPDDPNIPRPPPFIPPEGMIPKDIIELAMQCLKDLRDWERAKKVHVPMDRASSDDACLLLRRMKVRLDRRGIETPPITESHRSGLRNHRQWRVFIEELAAHGDDIKAFREAAPRIIAKSDANCDS